MDVAEVLVDRLKELQRAVQATKDAIERLATALGCAPKTSETEARDLLHRQRGLSAQPQWPPSLVADRFSDGTAVQQGDALIKRARAGRAARALLKECGISETIDRVAVSDFVERMREAELPTECSVADLEAEAQTACDHTQALRNAADLLRDELVHHFRIDPQGLSPPNAALLICLAELAAELPEASIPLRRAGPERDAAAIQEAYREHAALIERFEKLASEVDVEQLFVLDRGSLAKACRVFTAWSLLTGVTSRGREARRILRQVWIGVTRLPQPRRAAQLLSDAEAALAEAAEPVERDVIRRNCASVRDPRRLPLAALAQAAAWQAKLAAAGAAGVPRPLLNQLITLPEQAFRCIAAAAPALMVLRGALEQAKDARGLDEVIERAARRAEVRKRLWQSVKALGLPLDLALNQVSRVADALQQLDAEREACADPLWSELFGSAAPPSEEVLGTAEQVIGYARRVHDAVPEAASPLLANDAARLVEINTAIRSVEAVFDGLDKARAALREIGAEALAAQSSEPFHEMLRRTKDLIAQRALIVPTLQWRGRLDAARGHPLAGPLAAAAEAGRIAPERLGAALAWCVARRLASSWQAGTTTLRLTGNDLTQTRDRFRRADQAFLEANAAQLRLALLARKLPSGSASGPRANWTEMALINNELTKKTRFVPIRKLRDRAFDAVTTLFPCVMMSPLSVAELLPARQNLFDLIVMDKASQIRPKDAFGSLLRGQQTVIVGDPKQLPPTSFFDRPFEGEEDEDDDALPAAESVLDLAMRCFAPHRRLLWHYRSRHQSLIAFSNRHFYDDELAVFPAAVEPGEDLGVELRWVGGRWRGGESHRVNIEEAQAVVAEVATRAARRPDLSMGVVTMNKAQAELIEREIELHAATNEALRRYLEAWEERTSPREPCFVKNLENVQGDDRDVMVISLGYGKSEDGVLHQRFAPIHRTSDGDRRLNVLFTRARSKIVVFASLQPEEILADGKARGVRMLRDYLAYARERGVLPALTDGTTGGPESPFEEAVRRTLRGRGYDVVSQLGVQGYRLDLAVRDPDDPSRYVIGIECDGATYHSARCVRDHDRLRLQNLERLGWRIERVWSTDWFRDPGGEAERLVAAIVRAIEDARWKRAAPALLRSSEAAVAPTGGASPSRQTTMISTQSQRHGNAEVGGPAPTAVPAPASGKAALLLEEVLQRFRDDVIQIEMPEADPARGLLRDALLREIVRQRLDDPDDFHRKIPLALRERTDSEQVRRFLEDVCDLVARRAGTESRPH